MQTLPDDSIECEISSKNVLPNHNFHLATMSIEPVPDPLAKFLSTYCDVEALEMTQSLSKALRDHQIPEGTAVLFRKQFIEAIQGKILTPQQFEAITGDDEYTTSAELRDRLRELWSEIFPDEDIPEA
jgi:hypothetical protein